MSRQEIKLNNNTYIIVTEHGDVEIKYFFDSGFVTCTLYNCKNVLDIVRERVSNLYNPLETIKIELIDIAWKKAILELGTTRVR